ncbi:hypothetical protein ACS0TY_007251 [Phlomoides rotata]
MASSESGIGISARNRSVSFSVPSDSSSYEPNLVGFTGPLRIQRGAGPLYPPRGAPEPKREGHSSKDRNDDMAKNEHLLRSGQLGVCNDPYCTTCPIFYNVQGRKKPSSKTSEFDAKFHNMIYGDAKGWAKRMWSFLLSYTPGVMNPHTKVVQRWNQFFMISCSFAVLVDPFFFLLLFVHQDNKCVLLNKSMNITLLAFRTITDFMYVLHILLQFRLAYVAPESRVAGSGDLVDNPGMIAWNYFRGYFFVDLFTALPLPQIIILLILPGSIRAPRSSYAKDLLPITIVCQFIPRLYRLLPLVYGSSLTGFIFESSWSDFAINILMYVLASHVVGSCWYLFGLQRVDECLRKACRHSNITTKCFEFIDCGRGISSGLLENDPAWEFWKKNENATACFVEDGFDLGMYRAAVNLTTHKSVGKRYVYSLFWGFQQISTLAGNQTPSYYTMEVVFTMAIIGLGLLLFALLIGNMQNFLQALGRRRLEMSLRRRDVEQWMRHRALPPDLQRQVKDSERFNWAATRGVNEEMLMENLPEDLQREIRRHLFKYIKKVQIFRLLDEPIVDAICERLKTKTYIKGSKILYHGGLIDKMVFIIRGKMESTGEDGISSPLSEGDVCGEELITWSLEHSSVNKDGTRIRISGHKSLSNRVVSCLTYVEAFVLRASDLEEVTSLFARFLKSPRVQGAIRYESPYWKGLAARRIQDAWRHRKKRINRADSSSPPRI